MIPTEIKRALDNGITQEEIIEISTTLAFFIGWKAASEAVQGIIQVFRDLTTTYTLFPHTCGPQARNSSLTRFGPETPCLDSLRYFGYFASIN